MAGRTSPIVVDANFNTAAACSAANKSNNNTGIAKFKTGGRRRGVGVVGPSQRMKLGRNKNKESNNEGDAAGAVAVPPPLLPSNTEDDVIDKGASTVPSASVAPQNMTSPAPHLYAEIIVPTKRRRPFGHNPSSSAGCAAPAATTTNDIDKSESQENVDDVISLSFTSVSSMTGRSSLFGPNTGGIISNRSGGENANNGIMPPTPYQNILSSILWCPFGGDTNDTKGNNQVGTLKEVEVEDYFDYSDNMQGSGAGDVLKGKGDDIGEFDADEDGGGGMITMLLGVWNETFISTCHCFDSMGMLK